MPNNDNQNKNASSVPEGLSSIADDEAITEINLTDFLEENSKSSPLFEGFHEDIERTEKSLESELQSLYDDIMGGSGGEPIVPKPMSVLTASESEPKKVALSDPEVPENGENSSLDDLWMDPEEYFDDDIPVVSLDSSAQNEYADSIAEDEIPEEAFLAPEEDKGKSDILSMIDMLKAETDSETGFSDILSEIESNPEIAPVETELSSAVQLVSPAAPAVEEEAEPEEPQNDSYFNNEDFDWDELDFADEPVDVAPEFLDALPDPEPVAEETQEQAEIIAQEEPEVEIEEEPTAEAEETPEIEQEADAEHEDALPEAEDSSDFSIENANKDIDIDILNEELLSLLGEETPEEKPTASAATGFVIDIPDDGNDYEAAAAFEEEKLYQPEPMSTVSLADDPDLPENETEEEDKKSKKSKKEKKEKPAEKSNSSGGAGEVVRKIVLTISIITIVVSCGILANTYVIEPLRHKADADALAQQMESNMNEQQTAVIDQSMQNENPDVVFPDGMLAKYAQLYTANSDLSGWISIPGFEINLPIAQGDDNDYYLKKNIYKKYTNYGVPFFDYRMSDLRNLHRNTVIYGHNMRHSDYIFGMLENYRTIDGFAQAPVIECNTIYGDHTWFVYAVFISNSKESDDNGYVFPYNFIDISDAKFEDYIEEIDKRKFYTTGIDINKNDKILTLSTCCYDFDDARLVVVARERREGESINVDTSKAYKNDNPKYPQIWYNVNNKTNPFAEDAHW